MTTPTYVAHPANLDAEEAFAIMFTGPKDGPMYNEEADAYFMADAEKMARFIVASSTPKWRDAFRDAVVDACNVVDDYFDEASDDDATAEAFAGGPLEKLEQADFISMQQLAS